MSMNHKKYMFKLLRRTEYVFDHITYSLNGYSHEWRLEETMSFIQSNNLGTPSPCLLFPYKDAHHEVVFKSDDPEAFPTIGRR